MIRLMMKLRVCGSGEKIVIGLCSGASMMSLQYSLMYGE